MVASGTDDYQCVQKRAKTLKEREKDSKEVIGYQLGSNNAKRPAHGTSLNG